MPDLRCVKRNYNVYGRIAERLLAPSTEETVKEVKKIENQGNTFT